jgi:PKD repeat protein
LGPKIRHLAVIVFSLVLLVAISSAMGKSYWVATSGSDKDNPGTEEKPFATINFAFLHISASVVDTVVVKPGVYNDSLTFDTRAVVVRSEKGAKVTVVDGSGFKSAVVFDAGTPTSTVLDGFTVRGGTERRIMVRGTQIDLPSSATVTTPSSPEIKNCIIRGAGSAPGAGGTGIRLEYSRASLHNNLIDSNTSNVNGGGILILYSAPKVWSNRIEHNNVVDGVGGGIYVSDTLDGGSIIIQNNLIIGNYSYNDAGGVYISADRVYFANNLVYGNSSRSLANSAGLLTDYGTTTIINNIIANNSPYGVYCFGTSVYQANCFFGNLPATLQSPTCPISTGNFDGVDPMFVDSAGGDFHLQGTSPLIDNGVAPPVGSLDTDLDGFPRIVTKIDVGPYERTSCNLTPNFSTPTSLCAGQAVLFTNTSVGHYTLSIWDFGNGVVDSFPNTDATVPPISPKITYAAAGNYTVRVKLLCPYDLAPATAAKVISVNSKPSATFQADVKQGCIPLTVSFTNTSTGISRTDFWRFGDGITSTETSPTHVFVQTGVHVVKLVSTNACGSDSTVDTIIVNGAPIANFVADTTFGSSVLPVTFTGTATNNPSGWSWAFGDGGTATTQVASHNYTRPGIYDVSLTATNECGTGETRTLPSLITVYGFKLREVDSDTTNRLQQKFRSRVDTLYGLFNRNILFSGSIAPTPRRGSVSVSFNPTTAGALDTVTATAHLSRDLAAGSYQLRVIAQSVSNLPVDTLIWDFNSHPDTLIKLSAGGLVFDSVQVDTFAIDSIRVRNVSGLTNPLDLHVTNIVSTDPQFIVLDTSSGLIQPNGTFYIRVKFIPTSLGEKSAFLTITSDDPALPSLLVTLSALVIPERKPPFVVSADPAHNEVAVLIGSAIDFTMSEPIDPTSVTTGSVVAYSRLLHANIPGTARLATQTRIAFVPLHRYLPYDTIDVRLLGTVRDRSGNTLDSDGDGKGNGSPADDYTFWFVTGPGVYPGDCNNDGRVNEMDVLPLGVFYGMTGPRRDSLGEETGWGPKQAIEWSDKRSTYADADGNGSVDAADILVIALNWGSAQAQAAPTFPDGFDYRPYAAGLSSLLSNLGTLEGSATGDLIAQLLSRYVSSSEQIPKTYALTQNRPNPFNPGTEISYSLPRGSDVTLIIYNVIGQTVRVLVDGYENAGYRQVVWDGTDQSGREAASGVYFYRLSTDGFSQIRKMVKLR